MSTKYSPGPWEYIPSSSSSLPFVVIDADGKREGFAIDSDNGDGDACLIAAAPDLLEALEDVVRISDRKHDAWDRAHTAINKAKGLK